MSYSGLEFIDDYRLFEKEYSLPYEANVATLLTTGNGYMGVRASLEEYSSLGIQGLYIRGVMDEVVEVRLTTCDNLYMKKYYVEEERLKKFEKQERVINLLDFLLIRFEIGGEIFYPWEGKILSWKRWLDLSDGVLHREVIWENSAGQQTKFMFRRFASFFDDHIYCMEASCQPLNYSDKIQIMSGLDLRTKSNGQIPQKSILSEFEGQSLWQEEKVGPKYGFHAACGVYHQFSEKSAIWKNEKKDGLIMQKIDFMAYQKEVYKLSKQIVVVTSRDTKESLTAFVKKYIEDFKIQNYENQYKKHHKIYRKLFDRLEITIQGDNIADRAIRFSNYHSLISLEKNDHIHSFSAKGLTGETYNNFVWWDAEIFQAPVFLQTMPEYAKESILFRYSHLEQARELARKEGRKGARYPFTTGVTGEETVWIDVRHPFMQIHCVSDVGLSVLNYLTCTGDDAFLIEYGMEILLEICRYWISRVEWSSSHQYYGIYQVTGTDEHHPYVDNNAYTNYSVYHILKETKKLLEKYGDKLDNLKRKIKFTVDEEERIEEVREKLYLPLDKKTGMIPQFDGYFDLSRELEVQGSSSKSGYTQMKQSGLYNKSQIIKQPDVMMLFAYQDIPFSREIYCKNLDYYQGRCEAASSLSYCVHSICFADMGMPESTYGYLMETAEMDLKNLHGGTQDGIHSGCAAGAWMAVVRGIAGMKMQMERVCFTPHFIPWWKQVQFHCIWHGQGYLVILSNEKMIIKADEENRKILPVKIEGQEFDIMPGQKVIYEFLEFQPIR